MICLGYRGYMIKEFFFNYFLHSSDVTIDIATNTSTFHDSRSEPWKVSLVDTGESTLTGGRVLRVRKYLHPDQPFFLTYGDGVADIDMHAQIGVPPPARSPGHHDGRATACPLREDPARGRSGGGLRGEAAGGRRA